MTAKEALEASQKAVAHKEEERLLEVDKFIEEINPRILEAASLGRQSVLILFPQPQYTDRAKDDPWRSLKDKFGLGADQVKVWMPKKQNLLN